MKLKSIDEYHAEIAAADRAARATGVACPECGGELLWDPVVTLLGTESPYVYVYCEKCGHRECLPWRKL